MIIRSYQKNRPGRSFRSVWAFLMVLFCVLTAQAGFGQTYVSNTYNGNTGLSIPFAQSGSKGEFDYNPNDFNSLPKSGYIKALYFRVNNSSLYTATFSNFLIQMGQTTKSLTGDTFFTNVQTVYSATSLTLDPPNETWFSITLQHPFFFDSTKNLILIVSNTYESLYSFESSYTNSPTNTSTFRHLVYSSSYSSSVGTGNSNSVLDLGFNIVAAGNDAGINAVQSPSPSFCSGSKAVKVQLKNYGQQTMTSVNINWSVNRAAQKTYGWSGKLKYDSVASVSLGNFNFNPGTDTLKIWTSSPNGKTDSFNLNDTAVSILSVNAYPLAITGKNKTICSGGSDTLGTTSIGGHFYSWTSSPAGFTGSTSDPVVSPTVTTTYYLTEKINSTGCTASDSVIVTVNPAPAAKTGGSQTICFGQNVTIGSAAVSGDTYGWSSNPSGFSSASSNPTFKPATTTTTTYILKETITATGCSATNSTTVSINPAPAAGIGYSQSICDGKQATIGASAVSGDIYSWASVPAGFSSNSSAPTVSPDSTTTYILTETILSTGCSKTDSVKITVFPPPVPFAGSFKHICLGQSATVGSTAKTGHTYSWTSNPAGYFSDSASPTFTASVSGAVTFYLTETITGTGCSKTDSTVVFADAPPTAYVGLPQTICEGNSIELGTPATGGHSYNWISNPVGFSSVSANPTVAPAKTTTYILTESIGSACKKTDSVKISVSPLPAADAGPYRQICTGENAVIGSAPVNGDAYSWTSDPKGYISDSSRFTVSPSSTTTFILTETNQANCKKTDSTIVTVNPLPVANAGNPKTICEGSSTTIGANNITGLTYKWTSSNGGFISTQPDPTVSPNVSATYFLTTKFSSTGCSATSSVDITVIPAPDADWTVALDNKGDAVFKPREFGHKSYLWHFGNGTDSSAIEGPIYTYTTDGYYNVSLVTINSAGCKNEFDSTLEIQIHTSGIDGANNPDQSLNISPNPFISTTTISYSLSKASNVQAEIYDITGRDVGKLIEEKQIAGNYKIIFNTGNYKLGKGIYLLRLTTDNQEEAKRIMIY